MPKSKPKIDVVILAAGLGTRMKSDIPKVLHPIMGKPMIAYILTRSGKSSPPNRPWW